MNEALSRGARLAVAPGGIAEMFEGYPKPGTHPDEEYALVGKGFIKMAIRHGIPVVPIYCFGSTKLLRRVQLPFLEEVSRILRISICLFYGIFGLPIPFRQRLMYVVGQPIEPGPDVDDMYRKFCDELVRLFDRHKESYGWDHKHLKLLSR